jgi:hypothetical protein
MERPHPAELYHYTCDHGQAHLGDSGELLSGWDQVNAKRRRILPPTARFIWMTDMVRPLINPLGLTRQFITCDRTAHRYRVLDRTKVMWWCDVRRHVPAEWRDLLETSEGARPAHWFVSLDPVPVAYDPIRHPYIYTTLT